MSMSISEYMKIRGRKPPKTYSKRACIYSHLHGVLCEAAGLGGDTIAEIARETYMSMKNAGKATPEFEKIKNACGNYLIKLMTPKYGGHVERSWSRGEWFYHVHKNAKFPDHAPA